MSDDERLSDAEYKYEDEAPLEQAGAYEYEYLSQPVRVLCVVLFALCALESVFLTR
jgi:hypothetical protein